MSKMMLVQVCRATLIVYLVILSAGCTVAEGKSHLLHGFPVPANAKSIKKIELNAHSHQLFFVVEETYPSSAAFNAIEQSLTGGGWVICSDQSSDWRAHIDQTSTQQLLVHKKSLSAINKSKLQLLIMSAMYYSFDESVSVPDNNDQRIIVLVQKTKDLDREVARLGLDCS